MVAKLKTQLTAARKRASKNKDDSGDHLVAVFAGAALGVLNRKDIELPMAGEVGTSGVLAIATYAAGMYLLKGKNSARAKTMGATFAAIAVHEFVEDSDALSFLD